MEEQRMGSEVAAVGQRSNWGAKENAPRAALNLLPAEPATSTSTSTSPCRSYKYAIMCPGQTTLCSTYPKEETFSCLPAISILSHSAHLIFACTGRKVVNKLLIFIRFQTNVHMQLLDRWVCEQGVSDSSYIHIFTFAGLQKWRLLHFMALNMGLDLQIYYMNLWILVIILSQYLKYIDTIFLSE